jgi:MerR family transcriptional regulator, aldehyde-responsive regulator
MTNTNSVQHYTIREVATLSGLPESTLRYYETIGLIHPIQRDESSKQRVYKDQDVNFAIAIACLNATGLSIEDMRTYLKNRTKGVQGAKEQVTLLETQKKRLAEEAQYLELRQRYIDTKIAYWNAAAANDSAQIETMKKRADVIARELKLLKVQPRKTA